MALRAGYKGFKKLLPGLKIIRPGALGIDNTELSKTFFPRSEQSVLGAKNWFNYTKGTTTNNGVTFTHNADDSCTLSGEATADQAAIEMGTLVVDKDTEFILNGASSSNNAKIHIYAYDSTTNTRPYTDSSKTTVQTNNCFGTGNNKELPFFAEADHVIKIYARVQTTGTSVPSDTVFWPMVRLATDPDPTFTPYAMTNKELTERVQISGVIPATSDDIDLTHTESTTTITPNIGRTFILKMGKLRILSFYIAGVSIASGAWKELFRTSALPDMSGASANSYEICGACAIYESSKSVPLRIAHDGKVSIISSENLSNATVSGTLVYLAD